MTFRQTDTDDAIARELRVLDGQDPVVDQELEAARVRFSAQAKSLEELTPDSFWSRPQRARGPRRTAVFLAVAASLTVTALVADPRGASSSDAHVAETRVAERQEPELRAMGGAPTDLVVQLVPDDGGLRLQALLPDDAENGWLTVATLQDDGSGFVLASGTSHPAGPGSVWLNGRIRLNAYAGREWLVVAHGPEPLVEADAHRLLDTTLDDLLSGRRPTEVAGTSVWTTELRESSR